MTDIAPGAKKPIGRFLFLGPAHDGNSPMTRVEFADKLEHYAGRVLEIRGVGRNGPHAFVEDKSEIVAAMMAEARRLRVVAEPSRKVTAATIVPGLREIDSRQVRVEVRRRIGAR